MRKAQLLNQQQVYEKKLFHGTSPENVEAICEKNFDPRLHCKNKRLKLGQGTYFAVNAVCSHAYAKRDSDFFQYMFLAKVLVGCYTKGHPSYRRPPAKDFPSVDTHVYDSCVNEVANPTIFVVFDTNHFYPEYIIKYSSVCQPFSEPLLPPLSVPFSSEIAGVHQIGTLNNLVAACYTSGSSAGWGYSASTACSSEFSGVRRTANSNNLDSECSKTTFASLARYAAMAKGNFPYCVPFQPEPAMSHAELTGTSSTSSSYNLGTASTPSGCTTQSSSSASTMSNAQPTGTSVTSSLDKLSAASPPSAFTSCSGSALSSADFTGTKPRSSSDSLDTASMPSGSITQNSYSAPIVSNANLTGTSATGSSDNLGTASPPSASTTQSSYSASTVSSAELTDTT